MHASAARPTRWTPIAIAVLLLVAGIRLLLTLGHQHDPRAHDARASETRSVQVAGASLHVPRGWQRVEGAAGHATWAAPDRSASVTLGVVAASTVPLGTVVEQGVGELRRDVHGIMGVHVRSAGLRSAHVSFHVDRPTGRLSALQEWRRADGHDAIATWTWSRGAHPVHTPAPHIG